MCDVIFQTERKARKTHRCNSCEWLFEVGRLDVTGLTFAEYRKYIKLRRSFGRINPGDKYVQQTIRQDGEIVTLRYLTEAHELCLKLDAYPDFC